MKKLIQFSTSWCRPCREYKRYILEDLKPEEGMYVYVDLERKESVEPYTNILKEIGPIYGVPHFVVVDSENKVINPRLVHSRYSVREFFESNKVGDQPVDR